MLLCLLHRTFSLVTRIEEHEDQAGCPRGTYILFLARRLPTYVQEYTNLMGDDRQLSYYC